MQDGDRSCLSKTEQRGAAVAAAKFEIVVLANCVETCLVDAMGMIGVEVCRVKEVVKQREAAYIENARQATGCPARRVIAVVVIDKDEAEFSAQQGELL